ncbi:MAG TPA: hypothetical protein VNK48_04570 [Xanthobacteraceae bacterium]|nr:hypothetical protein [Xanthobacteraceae bacterium]
MTWTSTLHRFDWHRLRLTKSETLRLLAAGTAWGLATSAGLAGLTAWNYGMLCIPDVLATTLVAVAAGILTIGPIAAYARR